MKHLTTPAMTILALAAFCQVTGAQSGDATSKPMMGKNKTYTGCVEAGATAGTYTLTHAMDMSMGKDGMKKDKMAKEGMAKEGMAPMSMMLTSTAVDLSKHVGHKVSVTGGDHAMGGAMAKPDAMAKPGEMDKPMASMTVMSLKMVSATCTM